MSVAPVKEVKNKKAMENHSTEANFDLQTRISEVIKGRNATTEEVNVSQPMLVLEFSEIEIAKELGAGSFSCAYEIKSVRKKPLRNAVLKKLSPKVLANPLLFASVASDLMTEGRILASMEHPHIISFEGWSGPNMIERYMDGDRDACFLILERLDQNLHDRIAKWKTSKPSVWNYPSKRKSLEHALNRDKFHSAFDLAKGLEHLHSRRILHRDLKPQNIGYSVAGVLKIFDFDLSRVLPLAGPEESFKLTGKVGSPRYMAPEVSMGEPYNLKADVYSFGLLVYQILTLKTPFKGLDFDWSSSNKSLPKSWSDDLRLMMDNTLRYDGYDRPNMQDIVSMLEIAVSKFDEDGEPMGDSFADLFCGVPTYEDVEEMFCLNEICSEPCDPCANNTTLLT